MTVDRYLIQRMAERLESLQFYHDLPDQSALIREAHDYLDQPEPEGPTDEELRATLLMAIKNFPPFHPDVKHLSETEYELELQYRKARAIIAADRARCGRPAIKPVPVSERLPGEGDCDSEGRCWLTSVDVEPGWVTDNPEQCTNWTHWLPYHSLPVPATTTQETP